ncbi:MAG TPA: hypothetical protein VF255_11625 [Solirubrobacterales bacterium]
MESVGDHLHKRWVHSHEEDDGEEIVFRPSSFDLPPARGRRQIELRPDGSFTEAFPGPVDAPREAGGSWTLEGEVLALHPEGDRAAEEWKVVTAEDDRLRLRRLGGDS